MTRNFATLSEKEIDAFFDDIDRDNDGLITFDELEQKLDDVHDELAPEPQRHHLHHPSRKERDVEKSTSHKACENVQTKSDLHDFLLRLLPGDSFDVKVDREAFRKQIKALNIPSQDQTSAEIQDEEDDKAWHSLTWKRRARAYWQVQGPKILFVTFVVALIIAFGVWQMVIYIRNGPARAALGWGVILAKAAAGAIYPCLFFTILSMSRHFATFLRRFYILSLFVNWDRSQSFHVRMSLVSLAFATLHAIGHLTGTFIFGSRSGERAVITSYLGAGGPMTYADFASSLPGWTGITALATFWVIALLSMPFIRNRSYEIFQLGHLLMFLMIAMLCAHGTRRLLQGPMLGYWLAFPTLVILCERLYRIVRGFVPLQARMQVLDDDTVSITIKHPSGKWNFEAGQYILLQVPQVSFFQWHPFTISMCRDELLTVHIKTDGDWTGALRELPEERDIRVGVDGPFGAPAQRFYDYDRALIIGSGIGITPFSAILTDLEQGIKAKEDPWELRRTRSRTSRRSFDSRPPSPGATLFPTRSIRGEKQAPARRVDFHWMVRDKNYLLCESIPCEEAVWTTG